MALRAAGADYGTYRLAEGVLRLRVRLKESGEPGQRLGLSPEDMNAVEHPRPQRVFGLSRRCWQLLLLLVLEIQRLNVAADTHGRRLGRRRRGQGQTASCLAAHDEDVRVLNRTVLHLYEGGRDNSRRGGASNSQEGGGKGYSH